MDVLSSLKKLTEKLNKTDIRQLITVLSVPESVCGPDCEPIDFLFELKVWKNFDPFIFYQSLKIIRKDLVDLALNIKWLCNDSPQSVVLSVESFIEMLKREISIRELKVINMSFFSDNDSEEVRFENILKLLLEINFIQKDLLKLFQLLTGLKLVHLVYKLEPYKKIFEKMSHSEFISKFRKELTRMGKQLVMWDIYVKSYIKNRFQLVKQILGNDKQVSLEAVYVDLTILKQKPRYVLLEDETTYNEIAYLRKIAKKEVDISPIDLSEEFNSYDPSNPEIWCFIGNVGSGKTFLCNRIALRYGNNELSKFYFTLCIPCRKQAWHDMESSRFESGQPITKESICEWLLLGLPIGPSWTTDLVKYIMEMDGEGLLLIIDGLSQFTTDVPFNETLLYLFLTRNALSRSHIILTSRPGVWTDISTSYRLQITSFYHVLGFSPAQRDLYFEKQFDDASIRKRFAKLLDRFDEINQLSLIPINASLFSSLFNNEDSIRIHTLTQVYYALTLYLIRRQLTQMKLKEFSKVIRISEFDQGILECLYSIGEIAYQGVGMGNRIFDEKILLKIGEVEKASYCLGLVHEYVREDRFGILTKVWAFPHYSLQEFTGAIWLSSTSWRDQCLSVRYIVHTDDVFSRFRMSLRFLCGLLSDGSMITLTLLYRHLIPRPVPVESLPECVQLRLEDSRLFSYTGWEEFTIRIIQLSEMLFESNSDYISNFFSSCRCFLPESVYFYISSSVTPNEWISFLQSLPFFKHIHLIYVDTNYVTPDQFFNLTESIECSVGCLALKFSDNQKVLNYATVLQNTQLFSTKLSLNLESCLLTENESIKSLSLCPPDHTLSCLSLFRNEIPPDFLSLLLKQSSTCRNFKYSYNSTYDLDVLLSILSSPEINGLHLYDIPTEYHEQIFSRLSNIRELTWNAGYSILPHINHLTSLSYLDIGHGLQHLIYNRSDSILQLLRANQDSIRVLKLQHLHTGLSSLDIFFSCLRPCTNLVQLELGYTHIACDDTTLWCSMVQMLGKLLSLNLHDIYLRDLGMLSLCRGLVFNKTVKSLEVIQCGLSSDSCTPLTNLIPTLAKLKSVSINQLSEPETEPIEILRRTAAKYDDLEHDFK